MNTKNETKLAEDRCPPTPCSPPLLDKQEQTRINCLSVAVRSFPFLAKLALITDNAEVKELEKSYKRVISNLFDEPDLMYSSLENMANYSPKN